MMSLEKKFEEKYGEKEYKKRFSAEFRQAVSDMDKLVEILSRKNSENKRK